MNPRIDPARFLRRTLIADAMVCGASGVALLAAPRAIASRIGLASPALVAVLGVTLAVYGLALLRTARGERLRRRDAIVPIALNVAWLLGTAGVITAGWLDGQGQRILLLAGDVVIAFTILEAIGLHRLTAAATPRTSAAA